MRSPADKLLLEMIRCEETLLKFVKVASSEFIIIDKFCLWLQIHGMLCMLQKLPKKWDLLESMCTPIKV